MRVCVCACSCKYLCAVHLRMHMLAETRIQFSRTRGPQGNASIGVACARRGRMVALRLVWDTQKLRLHPAPALGAHAPSLPLASSTRASPRCLTQHVCNRPCARCGHGRKRTPVFALSLPCQGNGSMYVSICILFMLPRNSCPRHSSSASRLPLLRCRLACH